MSPCIIILHDFVPLVFCNVVVEVGVVSFLHSRLGVEHKNISGRLVLVAAVMFREESVRKAGQEQLTDEQISGSLMPQTNPVGVRRRRLGDIFSIQEKVPGGVRCSESGLF